MLLVATRATGVDSAVAAFVDARLAAALQREGYAPTTTDDSRAALAAVSAKSPPTVADLWRASYATDASYGVMFQVSAGRGRYVLQAQVASRDGRGPFRARAEAAAAELEACVLRLLAQTLPARASAAPAAATAVVTAPAAGAAASDMQHAVAAPKPEPDYARWRLAVQTESAFGFSNDGFFNQLAGARVDYRVLPSLSIGGYLGYADLRGRGGRVGSTLYYLQLEQRIALAPGSRLSIPLRFDLGYLIRNGSFMRVASGLAIPLGEHWDLVFDLLAPTFWLTPDNSLFSLDLAVELGASF